MSQVDKSNISELNTDLSKQMAVLREDIANLTAIVAEYGKAQAGQLQTAATDKASNLAKAGANAAHSAKATAELAYSDAEDTIRANPATAVGIAAGLGFLVGLLTTRR